MLTSEDDVRGARHGARRLLLLTAGSRGDVEPFLARAREVSRRGHDVVLAATSSMTAGLGPQPFKVVVLDGDLGSLVVTQGVSPVAALRSWRSTVHPALRALLGSAVNTALDVRPDVVVAHPKVLSAPIAAAVPNVPHVVVETVPTLTPTGDFPAAGIASRDLGRRLNWITYRATAGAAAALGQDLRHLRTEHGMPIKARLPPPAAVLCPVSPVLVPRPLDWPVTAHLTGPWQDTTAARPDPEVEDFLTRAQDDGVPVVVAGFGSMATGIAAAQARSRAVVAAVRAVGARVLVVTSWGGLDADARHGGRPELGRTCSSSPPSPTPRCSRARTSSSTTGAPAPFTPSRGPARSRSSSPSSPTNRGGQHVCTTAGWPPPLCPHGS